MAGIQAPQTSDVLGVDDGFERDGSVLELEEVKRSGTSLLRSCTSPRVWISLPCASRWKLVSKKSSRG